MTVWISWSRWSKPARPSTFLSRHPISIGVYWALLGRIQNVRLLIAFVLPWLTFFTIGRPLSGILCLILQITLIGWVPATIWAGYSLSQYKTDQKIQRALAQRSR